MWCFLPAGIDGATGPIAPPDREQLAAAAADVRETFPAELAAATPPEQAAAAQTLFKAALESGGKPAVRYTLIQFAAQQAAAAGNIVEAFTFLDRLSHFHDIEVAPLKAELFFKIVDAAKNNRRPLQAETVLALALPLVDEVLRADDFDAARRLVEIASTAARRLRNLAAVRELAAIGKRIDQREAAYQDVLAAKKTLAVNPRNVDANRTVGWWALENHRPQRALDHFARSGDATLAPLAARDGAPPADPQKLIELSEAWRALAASQQGRRKAAATGRAAEWYVRALGKLKGIDRAAAEKKWDAVLAEALAASADQEALVKRGNILRGLSPAAVRSSVPLKYPQNLFDGVADLYDDNRGYAVSDPPCEWTIGLDRPYLLQSIRLRLWDKDDRFYRYRLEVSANGEDFLPLADRSEGEWRAWQEFRFSPRPITAIRLVGLYNSDRSSPQFHVMELEAYCQLPAGR